MVDQLACKCRTARACLKTLNLQAHPEVAEFMDENGDLKTSLPHDKAVDVVYGNDDHTQFLEIAPFPAAPALVPLPALAAPPG